MGSMNGIVHTEKFERLLTSRDPQLTSLSTNLDVICSKTTNLRKLGIAMMIKNVIQPNQLEEVMHEPTDHGKSFRLYQEVLKKCRVGDLISSLQESGNGHILEILAGKVNQMPSGILGGVKEGMKMLDGNNNNTRASSNGPSETQTSTDHGALIEGNAYNEDSLIITSTFAKKSLERNGRANNRAAFQVKGDSRTQGQIKIQTRM